MDENLEAYNAVRDNLEGWLREDPSRLDLFKHLVENPTIEKIVDQVKKRTPLGYGVVIEVINRIFD